MPETCSGCSLAQPAYKRSPALCSLHAIARVRKNRIHSSDTRNSLHTKLHHMPAPADFWNRTATVYDQEIDGIFANAMRQLLLERLAREQELGRTVEFGCGTGYYTGVLAGRSAGGVVATDLSKRMIDLAREHLRQIPGIELRCADCEQTPFADASFDTAFFGLSFHFVDGPRTLAEMRRILRPGGMLILAIPSMEGLSLAQKLRGIVRNFRAFGTPVSPGSRLYTEQSIRELLAGSGFPSAEIEFVTDPAHPGGFAGLWVRAGRD